MWLIVKRRVGYVHITSLKWLNVAEIWSFLSCRVTDISSFLLWNHPITFQCGAHPHVCSLVPCTSEHIRTLTTALVAAFSQFFPRESFQNVDLFFFFFAGGIDDTMCTCVLFCRTDVFTTQSDKGQLYLWIIGESTLSSNERWGS